MTRENVVDNLVREEGKKADDEYLRRCIHDDVAACDAEAAGDEGEADDMDTWKR